MGLSYGLNAVRQNSDQLTLRQQGLHGGPSRFQRATQLSQTQISKPDMHPRRRLRQHDTRSEIGVFGHQNQAVLQSMSSKQ